MEYIIIFLLLIFLIMIILLKQINHIRKFKRSINTFTPIVKLKKYDQLIFYSSNPVLMYLYEKLYRSLKPFNKYDHKSYIIFTKIKTSNENQIYLDWISYTTGIIKMSIDTVIKMLKKKQNINQDFINNLAKLKLFYGINSRNIDINKINKNIIKYIKNKSIQTNRVIFNLFYINEILKNIYIKFFNSLDKSKLSKNIKKILKDEDKNNLYLYNSYLNNRLNKRYLQNKNSLFYDYFVSL
jgi:hypothetical protein